MLNMLISFSEQVDSLQSVSSASSGHWKSVRKISVIFAAKFSLAATFGSFPKFFGGVASIL